LAAAWYALRRCSCLCGRLKPTYRLSQELIFSIGKAANFARIVSVKRLTWDALCELFRSDPPVSESKDSAGWYCPAEFLENHRDATNFVQRYALTFDYDKLEPADVAAIEQTYRAYAYIVYTTASHTKAKPRIRMIFPLSRPATSEEFCAVTRKHGACYDLEKLARESDVPTQMMFLPTRRPDGVYKVRVNEGRWIDVDEVLAQYSDWRNRAEWPRRLQGDDDRGGDGIIAPDEKPGVVGDFCRAFRIDEAISRFDLPYTPGSGDRYTYTAGSRPDGVRIYDDGLKAHSEHDTDPAHGQTNAFDLVRLHKFGKLDTQESKALPITERPSYVAMLQFALQQPELRTAAVADEFADLGPSPDFDEQPTGASSAEQKTPIILARPLADVLNTPTMPRWLLRDRLERAVIALMAGPRGSYKSFISTDWAMEAAINHGPVYVASAEGADFDRRAKAWLLHKGLGLTASEIPLFVLERRIDLNQHENVEMIRQDCVRLGIKPVMFVLDTFSKLSGGLDENSNTEVKAFIGRLDNGLKRAFDATVLLVAHTGHTDKGRARGASALEADTDAAYIVSRNDAAKVVTVSRQRFKSSPELDPLYLEPKVIDLGYTDHDGENVTSLALNTVAKPDANMTGKGNADGLSERQRATLHALTVALAGRPDGMLTVQGAVDALVAETVPPTTGRDNRALNAKRTLQSLVDRGMLFLKQGHKLSLMRGDATGEFA
jgi:hypothetical protein